MNKILKASISIIVLLYVLAIVNTLIFQINNFTSNFGYMDSQEQLSNVVSMVSMKVPFKDYYFEYGLLFLGILSIGYMYLGQNYFALVLTSFVVLPIISTIISIYIGKYVLRNKSLIALFMFFCFLFIVNYHYTSFRHLLPELSLSLVIAFISTRKLFYLKVSAILAGLSLFAAFEYGVALWVSLLGLVVFYLVINRKPAYFNYAAKYLVIAGICVLPFILVLGANHSLGNFLHYNADFMSGFYFGSPCAKDTFPRLGANTTLGATLTVELYQKLNFYLIPVIYLVSAFLTFIKAVKAKGISEDLATKTLLIGYGSLAFVRTLNTPCMGYFTYGLIPFFLLLVLYIKDLYYSKKLPTLVKGILLFSITAWFIYTGTTDLNKIFDNINVFIKNTQSNMTYYKPAGFFLKGDFANAYNDVAKIIEKETTKEDYLYVYPWGPYNEISGRKFASPVFYGPVLAQVAGEKYNTLIVDYLKLTKPKLVVINIYNNLAIALYGKERKDIAYYYSNEKEDGPVFSSYPEANPIEKYILENYKTLYVNRVAIVMQRRQEEISIPVKVRTCQDILKDTFQVTLSNMLQIQKNGYKPLTEGGFIYYTLPNAVLAKDIIIEQVVDPNILTKYFGRYLLRYTPVDVNNTELNISGDYLTKRQSETITGSIETEAQIKGFKITYISNLGIAWWLKPNKIFINSIQLCTYTK